MRDGESWIDHRARLEQHHTSGGTSALSYRVLPPKVLNAADYGVPQKRERVFFVGFRADMGVEWSFPRETHSRDALLWDQYRDGDYWRRHEVGRNARPNNRAASVAASRVRCRPDELP